MTHPSTTDLRSAVEALHRAGAASTICAASMIRAGGMAEETRLALDCADVCAAAARVLSRAQADHDVRSAVVSAVVGAALAVCDASATACGRHADHHEHCRAHSAAATECAQVLRALPR